jgi:hypothetical protein
LTALPEPYDFWQGVCPSYVRRKRAVDGATPAAPNCSLATIKQVTQTLIERSKVMKRVRVLFTFGFLLMAGSVTALAQSVQTDYDRSFDLSRLKSYAFYQQERKPGEPLAASPLNDRRIRNALDSQLRAHGFSDSMGGRPDFLVAYFVTTQKGVNIEDNRFGPWLRRGTINVNQVTEGTLVVVFVDSTTKQEVWRGVASGEIDQKGLDKDVNKGVAKLVEKFLKDQAGKK